jgi:hypothetical protein
MGDNLSISKSQFIRKCGYFPIGLEAGKTYRLRSVLKAIVHDARFLPDA